MRIAIVEDEVKLAATLKDGLETEGYSVDVFHTAESAEKEFEKNPSHYQLLILDLMLPKRSGFEVCEGLRKKGSTMLIIVLTARDSIEDKVRILDSGADDFLAKPFAFEELVARIRATTRRTKHLSSEKVRIGNIFVNMGTYEVERDSKAISLTPTEFDLLRLLIDHHGRVASRAEISSHLWDVQDVSLSNIVDVHISNLRKKLDDNDQKIIRTVRGAGYAIQE
jgi:DNA-binding response OmpR family regulator